MTGKKLSIKILLAIVLGSCTLAIAEEHQQASEESKDWYQVEVILVQHSAPETEILEFESRGERYRLPNDHAYYYPYGSSSPSPHQLSNYSESARALEKAAKNLGRSKHEIVLASMVWTQILAPNDSGTPIKLNITPEIDNPFFYEASLPDSFTDKQFKDAASSDSSEELAMRHRIEGNITLRRSRYAHFDVDLYAYDRLFFAYEHVSQWFLDTELTALPVYDLLRPLTINEAGLLHSSPKPPGAAEFNTVRFKQSRRMRSGEVHYLDHPLFGAIIKLTPVE